MDDMARFFVGAPNAFERRDRNTMKVPHEPRCQALGVPFHHWRTGMRSATGLQRRQMTRLTIAVIAAALLVACTTAPPPKADVSAGYDTQRIADADGRPIQLDVWYPAKAAEQAQSYNFGMGSVAKGAAVAGDKLPVVLLSHGSMGAASNYSWIAEPLARHGYVVLGVSHFGESPAFGPATMNPATVAHFGDRTRDINTALDFLITKSAYASHIDPQRLGALGHSSGGATVLMLAGVGFSMADMRAYCVQARPTDKGCQYPVGAPSSDQAPVPSPRPIKALVVMDPAAGPGFTQAGLRALKTPALVIGSVDDDFLPFAAHAGRISEMLGSAETVQLAGGEGHFVYVDRCNLPINVMGVKLCSDRAGVDRDATHAKLVPQILSFFDRRLAR
jgi:predicted dienelactone hydrolase